MQVILFKLCRALNREIILSELILFSSEKGSAPLGAKLFSLRVDPFTERDNNNLEFLP